MDEDVLLPSPVSSTPIFPSRYSVNQTRLLLSIPRNLGLDNGTGNSVKCSVLGSNRVTCCPFMSPAQTSPVLLIDVEVSRLRIEFAQNVAVEAGKPNIILTVDFYALD